MMQDIALGQVIGISALIYFAIGIGLQFVRVSVYRDNIIVMILISAAGTSAYAFLYGAISAMLLEVSFNIIAVLKYISVAAILNFICMVITVHFARKIKGFTA